MDKLNDFLMYLAYQQGLSSNTVLAYKKDLEDFLKFIDKVENINKEDIFDYIKNIKEEYTQNTVLRKYSSIKSFLKFLFLNKYIKTDLLNYMDNMHKTYTIPNVVKIEDIYKILDTFNHTPKERQYRLILLLLLSTGARISEIINLKTSDITDNDYEYIKVFGKGQKYRLIPVLDNIREEIREYINNYRKDLKCLNNKMFNVTRNRYYQILKEHAKKVGIEKIYPHLIRHSVATSLLKNGGNIRIVQEILGHKDISTTQIYTHVDKKKLKEQYDKIKFSKED